MTHGQNSLPHEGAHRAIIALKLFILTVLSIDLMLSLYSNGDGLIKLTLFSIALISIRSIFSWIFLGVYLIIFVRGIMTV